MDESTASSQLVEATESVNIEQDPLPLHSSKKRWDKLRFGIHTGSIHEIDSFPSLHKFDSNPSSVEGEDYSRTSSRKTSQKSLLSLLRFPSILIVPESESLLRSLLNFLFRVPLPLLYVIYILFYFMSVMIFVGLIYIAAKADPSCIRCGSSTMSFEDIEFDSNTAFSCAFLLSWVTFSTVGYGNAWPAQMTDSPPIGRCYFINFVLFFDAFSGIIFVGLCGAILYSRAQKIQSIASILFSDIAVVRFGSGLYGAGIDYEDDSLIQTGIQQETVPCPILEFRILNTTGENLGSEIIDAQLYCMSWASSEAVPLDSIPSITRVGGLGRIRFPFRRGKGNSCSITQGTLDIVNPTHPYFQHIWTAQHILNESSPLLTNPMKEEIQRHAGKWPKSHSNFQSIRQNIVFDEIVISFSGIYNLSGTAVYGGKTYYNRDIIVGYEFVHSISKGDDDKIVIESDQFHDIVQQKGDDEGEPLNDAALIDNK